MPHGTPFPPSREQSVKTTLPILTFHGIDDAKTVLSFPPQVFERSIARLKKLGYRAISLVNAVDSLRRAEGFPERSCVITFDDGYQSVYANAFPVLERQHMTATVFLTVGDGKTERLPALNGRAMLSWDEMREMQRCGIDFGAHTLTHPDLTALPVDRIETEMRRSKEIIEQALGAAAATFAYPYGRYDARSCAIARKYFACAVSDRLGLVKQCSDVYALERVETYYLRHERFFEMMPTRWFELYLLARRIPRDLRRRVGVSPR
jgi:peptidoglycan/xylan/chitin deacetylase (PgdA/CDA1 family)